MRKSSSRTVTSSRKRDHVLLTVRRDVEFRGKGTGLDEWEFVHNALPEINLSEISAGTVFLSKPLSMPFMISCMTGGYAEAEKINRQLAEVCEEHRLAMGVGSQRQALEDRSYHASFSVVRKAAPTIPIVGNLGAAEVARLRDAAPVQRLAELVGADAFVVHLNPLQELLQPEGNTDFRGVLAGIERLVKGMAIPVIVKEIGAGISKQAARRLLDVGVSIIDVAGAGGTSWAGVEILRLTKKDHAGQLAEQFWDWGIRTADALVEVASLRSEYPKISILASGGVRHGLDAAKAIALGADMTAAARPMLRSLIDSGRKGLIRTLELWEREFKGTMFLVGAGNLSQLRIAPIARSAPPLTA